MPSRIDPILKRQFITSDDVRLAIERGDGVLTVHENCTVTAEARELAVKHSLRLEESANVPAQATARSTASAADGAVPSPRASSDDLAARVSHAVAAVFQELNLGDRAAALRPIVTRRVLAGLTPARS